MVQLAANDKEFAASLLEMAKELPPPKPQSITDKLTPTGDSFIARLARGAVQAIGQGVADIPRVMHKLSDVMAQQASAAGVTVPKSDIFKRLAEAIEPTDFSDERTLAEKIGHVLGGLVVAIPKYAPATAAGPLSIPAFGAIGAATAWGHDLPPSEIAKHAAIDAAFGGLLKIAGQMPRATGTATMAVGAPAIEVAATQGELPVEDYVLSGLTMGTLRALGHKLPTNLEKAVRDLGYPKHVYQHLPIKELRRIVREKRRFEPPTQPEVPPAPPPAAPPEPVISSVPGELRVGQEGAKQISELREHHARAQYDFIINKALQDAGFSDQQISAMPFALRLALARSNETSKSIHVDPIDGTATRIAPTPEPTVVTNPLVKQVIDLWTPKNVPQVDALLNNKAVDARVSEALARVAEQGVEKTQQQPVSGERPTTFNAPKAKAKKAKQVKQEEPETKPKDQTVEKAVVESTDELLKLAESLGMSREEALGIMPAEILSKAKVSGKIDKKTEKLLKQFEELKIEDAEADRVYREIVQRALEKEGKSQKEAVPAAKAETVHKEPVQTLTTAEPTKAPGIQMPTNTTEAIKLGASWQKDPDGLDKALGFWRAYIRGDIEDPVAKQMLRETVEGYLGFTGLESATKEQIIDLLTKKVESRRPAAEAPTKVSTKTAEKPAKRGKEHPFINELQRLGFDKDDPRLKNLNEDGAKAIIEAVATPREVAISSRGGVAVYGKPTDIAVQIERLIKEQKQGKVAPTEKPKAQEKAKEEVKPVEEKPVVEKPARETTQEDIDALMVNAAEWMGIDRARAKAWLAQLGEEEKALALETYLKHIDKNIETAITVGNMMSHDSVVSARKVNDIITKDEKMSPSMAALEKNARAKRQVAARKKEAFEKGETGEQDYNLAEAESINASKIAETKRLELLKNEIETKDKVGSSERIGILSEGDMPGLLVRTKISDTIDEIAFITRPVGSPESTPSTSLKSPAKLTVDTSSTMAVVEEAAGVDALPKATRDAILEKTKQYYTSRGMPFIKKRGEVTLRMGIDVDKLAEIGKRTKRRLMSIYQNFASRQGANKSIKQAEQPGVYKFINEVSEAKLSDLELAAMRSSLLPRGSTPHIEPTAILGVAVASKHPAVRFVALEAAKNEIRIAVNQDRLVRKMNSKLNEIFRPIESQPNAKELMHRLGLDMENYTKAAEGTYTLSDHPLLVDARNKIISLMDEISDVHDLRQRGFFRNKYYPLIVDMESTYQKIRAMFQNAKSRDDLPNWFKMKDKNTGTVVDYLISEEAFDTVRYITNARKTWSELTSDQKNLIKYHVLRFEGLPTDWVYAPPEVQDMIPRHEFNPHLQQRTGGGLLEYNRNPKYVLASYLMTMVRHESNQQFLDKVAPIINQFPSIPGDPLTVRAWMEKIVKQTLRQKTPGDRILSSIVDGINNRIGKEVLGPNFVHDVTNRVVAQTVRGVFGPDTALRNLADTLKTITMLRKLPTLEQVWTAAKATLGSKDIDPQLQTMFGILFGREAYATHGESIGQLRPRALPERLAHAQGKFEKALAFYDWVGDMALAPFRATEHFNRFLAFQMALDWAASKGFSFREGVRLGLSKMMDIGPDLIIPDAYWKAYETVLRTQGAFGAVTRNPLMRGPLAKITTLFWSYPANMAQFITRGLIDSARTHDYWGLLSYSLYTGFQLSIAAVLAQLGLDVSSFFGVGLMPIKLFSLPWDLLKNAYITVAGETAADRERGSIDFLNEVGTMTIPQFRYGKKVIETMTNLEDGFKRAGKRELAVIEMTPLIAMMDLIGYPYIGRKEVYDLVEEMSDRREIYTKRKREVVIKAINAIKDGNFEKVRDILEKARKDDIVLPYSDLMQYYRLHMQKTYLQSHVEKLPKHLRAPYIERIKELEERFLPSRFEGSPVAPKRSMWSAPRQIEAE